jgi:hypothetical protein
MIIDFKKKGHSCEERFLRENNWKMDAVFRTTTSKRSLHSI